MKKYAVKEVFPTLQGEGANTGRRAVFLRFAGCNLGYGVCPWCDTDWMHADHVVELAELLDLVRAARSEFTPGDNDLLVVTGGEPSLQLDRPLADALREEGLEIAMETNGSRLIDRQLVDWLTVSPKQKGYVQRDGDEIKLVFTGSAAPGITPDISSIKEIVAGAKFNHYFLQPVDLGGQRGSNYADTVAAVTALGPPWRLGIQVHKILGLR